MIYKWTTALLILLAAFALAACNSGGNRTAPEAVANLPTPQVWLEWPLEDSQHPLGEIGIQAQVHNPGGQGPVTLQLLINGDPEQSMDLTGSEHMSFVPLTWQPTEPGEYVIEVRVAANGIYGEPDYTRVRIVENLVVFTADKTTVRYGGCTTLRWMAENAQEVVLEGKPVSTAGSREVCPQQAANTYRLTAISSNGEMVERVVTISVPPTPPPPPEVEVSFEVDDSNFKRFGDSVLLTWRVKNAQSVQLDGASVGLEGSQQVYPTQPRNVYRLTAASLQGDEVIERTIIVNVPATPAPTATPTSVPTSTAIPPTATPIPTPTFTPIPAPTLTAFFDYFYAEPDTISYNGCTTLYWRVENVESIYLNGGRFNNLGVTGPDGQIGKQDCGLTQNTTYHLTAKLSDGRQLADDVTVTVGPAPDTKGPPAPNIREPDGLVEACDQSDFIDVRRGDVVLWWDPASDRSGILDYLVELETRTGEDDNGDPIWGELQRIPSMQLFEDVTKIIECCNDYRWRVRARDQAGNVGDFSRWAKLTPVNQFGYGCPPPLQ
jgi:hypothetical protein